MHADVPGRPGDPGTPTGPVDPVDPVDPTDETPRHPGHRPDTPTAVELHGVSRWYDVGDHRVYALRGIDLEVDEGEFVVVLGPSDSGKTTLLNMIGALDAPSEGQVVVAGRDVTGAGRRELFRLRRETRHVSARGSPRSRPRCGSSRSIPAPSGSRCTSTARCSARSEPPG